MKIFWVKSNKEPSNGDLKIMKSGQIFVRKQQVIDGCYRVQYGKPVYVWYKSDSDEVKQYTSGALSINEYFFENVKKEMVREYIPDDLRHIVIKSFVAIATGSKKIKLS